MHTAPETPPAITIHFPNPEALQRIAGNLSQADRDELAAAGHTDPHKVITEAVAGSREAWIARWSGEPQAVFGVTDYARDGRFGVPWMLSTGTGHQHAREFMELSRNAVAAWSPMYMALANVVSEAHPTAHAWLKALGFVPVATHDVHGHPFTEYAHMHEETPAHV